MYLKQTVRLNKIPKYFHQEISDRPVKIKIMLMSFLNGYLEDLLLDIQVVLYQIHIKCLLKVMEYFLTLLLLNILQNYEFYIKLFQFVCLLKKLEAKQLEENYNQP